MKLSKERLRKMYSIPEYSGPVNPAVIARRRHHERAAKWMAKIHPNLETIAVSIGFFLVLLPILSRDWRAVIEDIPVVSTIFRDYSTLTGVAIVNFFLIALFGFLLTIFEKHRPSQGRPGVTFKHFIDMELYPNTSKQEFVYWLETISRVVIPSAFIYIPFGILAFIINIGK